MASFYIHAGDCTAVSFLLRCAHGDELCCDGNGDLCWCFGLDVETDRRGDACKIRIIEPIFFAQFLVHACFFAGTADDADIAGRRAQQLCLNDSVESVAACHDAGVIFFFDADRVVNVVEIHEKDILSIGEKRFLSKLLTVVHGDTAEANMSEYWHQLLSNMSAAENVYVASGVDLFDLVGLTVCFDQTRLALQ